MNRLKSIKEQVIKFENDKDKFQTKISDVQNFMSGTLKEYFHNLQTNSLSSKCTTIKPNGDKIELQPAFDKTPEVFIVSNRFEITYGTEGVLQKKKVGYEAAKDSITFKYDTDVEDAGDVPICYIAVESEVVNSNR